jgi:hypothetical protein
MEGGAVGHNIERGPPKDNPNQICFILIDEGNRSNQRKPSPGTSHRETLLHKVVSSIPRHERDSNSQRRFQIVVYKKNVRRYNVIKTSY